MAFRGGIDSPLVATIACEALGPDNVLGALMPSPYSSDHSVADAVALSKNLGMHMISLPIKDAMRTFDAMLVEGRLGAHDICMKGYKPELVRRIALLVNNAEFKRRQNAPVLKITENACGSGWRMPIACTQAEVCSVNTITAPQAKRLFHEKLTEKAHCTRR